MFTGALAAPRAEFEAGRYERTVQLLAGAESTPQVRYLMPVHLYGAVADLAGLTSRISHE